MTTKTIGSMESKQFYTTLGSAIIMNNSLSGLRSMESSNGLISQLESTISQHLKKLGDTITLVKEPLIAAKLRKNNDVIAQLDDSYAAMRSAYDAVNSFAGDYDNLNKRIVVTVNSLRDEGNRLKSGDKESLTDLKSIINDLETELDSNDKLFAVGETTFDLLFKTISEQVDILVQCVSKNKLENAQLVINEAKLLKDSVTTNLLPEKTSLDLTRSLIKATKEQMGV